MCKKKITCVLIFNKLRSNSQPSQIVYTTHIITLRVICSSPMNQSCVPACYVLFTHVNYILHFR